MARVGLSGGSLTNPEPPPEGTRWVLHPTGYRIGVHPSQGVIVEPLDYHPGYLALERSDLERLLAELGAV